MSKDSSNSSNLTYINGSTISHSGPPGQLWMSTMARIAPCPTKGQAGPGGDAGCQTTLVKAKIQEQLSISEQKLLSELPPNQDTRE